MPSLKITPDLNSGHTAYLCDACNAIISTLPAGKELSGDEVRWFNAQFWEHCKDNHPNLGPATKLPMPDEDVNQAAARIVREATED
jgi:hypothetical protein